MIWAIIVLMVLGLAGLAGYLLWRRSRKKQEYDEQFAYTTKHGIRVKLSERMKDLPVEDVEEWTEDVVNFWFDAKGCSKEESYKYLARVTVFMYDQDDLICDGVRVEGLLWPSSFKIEMATLYGEHLDPEKYTPYKKVKSLFRHETSHVIAGYVGKVKMTNEIHHALFAEVKLGA